MKYNQITALTDHVRLRTYGTEQFSEQPRPHDFKPVCFGRIKDENDNKAAQKGSIPTSTLQSTQ